MWYVSIKSRVIMPERGRGMATKEKTRSGRPVVDTYRGMDARRGNVADQTAQVSDRFPLISAALAHAKYTVWYVQTLLCEIRNLPRRIHMVSERMNRQDYQLELGPSTEETLSGYLVPCKATIGRMEYITSLLKTYPWLTGADVLLALDGWDVGSGYYNDILGIENKQLDISQKDQYPLPLVQQRYEAKQCNLTGE